MGSAYSLRTLVYYDFLLLFVTSSFVRTARTTVAVESPEIALLYPGGRPFRQTGALALSTVALLVRTVRYVY
jgi:hypothetical protein